MNEEYEQIAITTAARRIAREVNSTNHYFDIYFDTDGKVVDLIEHGCWRDNTPSHPFPVEDAVLCVRGVMGAPFWIDGPADQNHVTWQDAQRALNDALGK